jgi:UPF0755 protein
VCSSDLFLLRRHELARRIPALPSRAGEDFRPAAAASSQAPCRAGFFLVRPGEGLEAIAARFRRLGWIRSAWVLRREARRAGWDRKVLPGWYPVRVGDRVLDLTDRLAGGRIAQAKLTIPEGWNLRRILPALADSTWTAPDSLAVLETDRRWLEEQMVPGPGLEGYLFPETYFLPKGEPARRLLAQMLRPGLQLWQDSLAMRASALGLSRRELWALASMIESEAARDQERARISAVFWNRLRLGMRLESDPTVQYALCRPPGPLSLRDLEVDSGYNTYRRAGLPPGPICSPGRASLWAALRPEADCRDLFFVARGDGSHVFSRTLAEHDRARRLIQTRSSGL